MSWRIRNHPKQPGTLLYRRRGDHTEQTAPTHLEGLLRDLERLEDTTPDWHVGFLRPSPNSPDKAPDLWAQYPGETVVHAPTVEELRAKIREARTTLNL